jgi:hypothetical protein
MRKRTQRDIDRDLLKNDLRGTIIDGFTKYKDLQIEDIISALCYLAAHEADYLSNHANDIEEEEKAKVSDTSLLNVKTDIFDVSCDLCSAAIILGQPCLLNMRGNYIHVKCYERYRSK